MRKCSKIFFKKKNCYLAASRPTLGHCWGSDLTNLMLITVFKTYSTQEPCNLVASQSLAKHLVVFIFGSITFRSFDMESVLWTPFRFT